MAIRRIWHYTKQYKALLFVSMVTLIFSIVLDLVSPYLASLLIDDYIVGIEKPWYRIEEKVEQSVYYNGHYYIQERFAKDRSILNEDEKASIILINNRFYFSGQYIVDGKKTIAEEGRMLWVEKDDGETIAYYLTPLSAEEVFHFYQPFIKPVTIIIFIFALVSVASIFLIFLYRICFLKLGNRVTYDLRRDAFIKIQKMPISYFDEIPAGKIVSRITNDTETVIDLYSQSLVVFTQAAIYFIGIYISLFSLDVTLAAFSMLLIPLLVVWGRIYRKKAKHNNEVIRSENAEINAYLNESIKGMEVIQAFNQEERSYRKFMNHNDRYAEYRQKMVVLNSALSGNMVRLLRRAIQLAILLYFGWGALGFYTFISVGVIYAFVEYMNRLINPINQIFGNIDVLQQSLVSAERVFFLLDQPEEVMEQGDGPCFERGEVEFRNLSFAYEKPNYVLKDINLKVKPGQTVGIVGHTGSGKSTLMNLLLRFYDYEEGSILIDGVDIRKYPKQSYRRRVGIVLQDPILFTGTIASNIKLNNPSITDEKVEEVLIAIGAESFIRKFSRGIHEPVLEMGSNFSVGERQLISFARAMVYDPAVLVLDEATANIDTGTEQLIQHALQVVKQNRTTFVIAHRLSTIKDADFIVVLDQGRLIEQGTHDELMAKRGKYYEMYQSQLQHVTD